MRKIMDTLDKSSRDYEICLCKKLNRGYVEDLIKEKNIKTLKELCEVGDIGNVMRWLAERILTWFSKKF